MILENSFKPEDLLISLARGACLGTCPVFELHLDGAGKVTYCGKDFVKVTGFRTTAIHPDKVFNLLQYAIRIGFFDFKPNYETALSLKRIDGMIRGMSYLTTDMPTTKVIISVGKKSKTVTESLGAPLALLAFQKRIERTAGINQWI